MLSQTSSLGDMDSLESSHREVAMENSGEKPKMPERKKPKMPQREPTTTTESLYKEPLLPRFMDNTLNISIREEIKAPLQPRTFDSDDGPKDGQGSSDSSETS